MKVQTLEKLKHTRFFVWLNNYWELVLLTIYSSFIRLSGLGYSHFYGDETKILFTRKDISAFDFFLNQRKGPVQFVIAWLTENLHGGFDPFFIRLPFSVASILSIVVFYFVVKQMFSRKIAAIATFLMSFNGFFIAFGRTAQYQSVLLLLMLLSLLLALKSKQNEWFVVFSGVLAGLGVWTHWDTAFYIIPILLAIVFYSQKMRRGVSVWFVAFIAVSFVYLIPYIVLKGYVGAEFSEYITSRIQGVNVLPNNSLYTHYVYNPTLLAFAAYIFALFVFAKRMMNKNIFILSLWFLPNMVVLEFVISNPGTHIYNYILPLTILASIGIVEFLNLRIYGAIKFISLGLMFSIIFFVQTYIFVPRFGSNYPWNDSYVGRILIPRIQKDKYQLFVYGFPYYRGWDTISVIFNDPNFSARNYHTNDNLTISDYYIPRFPYYKYNPDYYIHVPYNQEFKVFNEHVELQLREQKYTFVQRVYYGQDSDEFVAIYKRTAKN